MNPALIVYALLHEVSLNPDEFVKGIPGLMARYEFIPSYGIGHFSVKRWEDGYYYYIGEVFHDEGNDLWMACKVAPCGCKFGVWYPPPGQAPERSSRRQAAEDLWKLYSDALEDGRAKCIR